jgi:excisionase family DNA binding protein
LSAVPLERLLTARELAELLGFQAGTIVDWSEEGKLPSFKVGGRLRFRESEVLDWLEARRKNGPAGGASANQHHRRPSGVGYVLPTSTKEED